MLQVKINQKQRVVAASTLLLCARPVQAGTLFGLQFQGEDLSLYSIPTVDPTLETSLVQVKRSFNLPALIADVC